MSVMRMPAGVVCAGLRDDEPRLFSLRSGARHAFYRAEDSRRGHPGAGYFLDLAGGARSVIDLDALAQPEIDDVLFAHYLIGFCRWCEHGQRETAKQCKPKPLAA
jgi:hypothetical protein